MARQHSEGEFNSFVKGLVTEAGPLTFPANASLSETNWNLLRDGSRKRRLGMDYEAAHEDISTSMYISPTYRTAYTTFLWSNAGGNANRQILVIQIGRQLSFLDRDVTPISSGLLHQEIIQDVSDLNSMSYAVVDGKLVVATSKKELITFDFDAEGNVTSDSFIIKVRDFFGVEDKTLSGEDLLEGQGINTRNVSATDAHLYNLRNQTWGPPRVPKGGTDYEDPVDKFLEDSTFLSDSTYDTSLYRDSLGAIWRYGSPVSGPLFDKNSPAVWQGQQADVLYITASGSLDYTGGSSSESVSEGEFLSWNGSSWSVLTESPYIGEPSFPSNADSVTKFLYPDVEDATSRTLDRFHFEDCVDDLPGSYKAPSGFFVIDALERGPSRKEEYDLLLSKNESLAHPISSLPADTTPAGCRTIESFAGRAWYAGFNGDVYVGDSQSPNLSSYVFFSQLVKAPSQIGKCYQDSDPTSKEAPDLLATDGGFIRVDGAYSIKKLISFGRSLVVLAENGVWIIDGGTDSGFSATNYRVSKISDTGVVGSNTTVLVEDSIIFWGLDSIYKISRDQFGNVTVASIIRDSIQTFFEDIDSVDKQYASAFYDKFDNKVRWLYGGLVKEGEKAYELIYDIGLQAFYPLEIESVSGGLPRPVGYLEVSPFRSSLVTDNVTYNGEVVTYNGDPVTYTSAQREGATRQTKFVVINGVSPATFTLGSYKDLEFKDWKTYDTVGVDAPAQLITGYIGDGDFKRFKQVPYLVMHMNKTETGFTLDGDGDWEPVNPSSCLVQAQWDWSDSDVSGRWGRQFQAYRHRRQFFPVNVSDNFDSGDLVITTKNKLRGKGRVVSFLIETEPEKDLHLLGWSLTMTSNVSV